MMRRRKIRTPQPGDMTVVGWAEQHTVNRKCKESVADHVTAMIAIATLAGCAHEVFTVQKGPDDRHSIVFVSRSYQDWEAFNTRVNLAAVLTLAGIEGLS